MQWSVFQRQIQVGSNCITCPQSVRALTKFCHHPGDSAVQLKASFDRAAVWPWGWLRSWAGAAPSPSGAASVLRRSAVVPACTVLRPACAWPWTSLGRTGTINCSPLAWLQPYAMAVDLPSSPLRVSQPSLLLCSSWVLWGCDPVRGRCLACSDLTPMSPPAFP